MGDAPLPDFDELPVIEGIGLRHAWDVLDGDVGTVALASPERIAAAAGLVRDGVVIGLNLPVTEPDPPLFGREPLTHEIYSIDRNTLDDRIDGFYPQGSSQWDGLRHVRAREHGFFGGVKDGFEPGPGALGIEHWARRGIVGRGVLLDVLAQREREGRPLDPLAGETIEASDLVGTADAQGVELAHGDIVCVRTGWIDAFRALSEGEREGFARSPRITGLSGSEEMARLVWDSHMAALATDNPSLEVAPGDPAIGSLHRRLIPMLGVACGELLDLAELARRCSAARRYEFLFVSVPMNLPGGVGSPANAVAIL
jgi:kynurenine formamidase